MTTTKIRKMFSTKHEAQTRYLSQAVQLEEAVNPHIIRATMSMVSLAVLIFVGWAGLTNINEVARTPGEVVPHGYQQSVQHLEGGIIKSIDVHEGDIVQEGQILVRLSDTGLKEDMERALSRQMFLEKQVERLRAFVEGREMDISKFSGATDQTIADQIAFFEGMRSARQKEESIIHDQISQKKQAIATFRAELDTARSNLAIAREMYDRRLRLNEKGYASDMQLLEDRRYVNNLEGEIKRLENQLIVSQTEADEFEDRLASLSARYINEAHEKLDQTLAEKEQNTELLKKLEDRIARLNIRSPAHGIVNGLGVNTIGAVVQPGQTIMEIVPMDKRLEVAVKISPQDIGHLEIDQPVQVKFSTFDFSRYGSVHGRLDYISAATFTGQNGERYYQGRVLLDQTFVGDNPDNVIMPGMTVMADVITGKKTILQYLLKPIHLSLKTAFTER